MTPESIHPPITCTYCERPVPLLNTVRLEPAAITPRPTFAILRRSPRCRRVNTRKNRMTFRGHPDDASSEDANIAWEIQRDRAIKADRIEKTRDCLLLALAEHALGPGALGNQQRLIEAIRDFRDAVE